MCVGVVRDYVPASWVTLLNIKSIYYKGRAHQHVSESLLWFMGDNNKEVKDEDLGLSNRALEILQYLHKLPDRGNDNETFIEFTMPTNAKERTYLGKSSSYSIKLKYFHKYRI